MVKKLLSSSHILLAVNRDIVLESCVLQFSLRLVLKSILESVLNLIDKFYNHELVYKSY